MKKVIMIALGALVISGSVHSQSRVHFGLKAGVNWASQHQDAVDFNTRTSFNAGGLAHIHVSKHLAVQPEIYYSGEGSAFGATKLSLNNVNVPVLIQYMAGNGFRLQTGPQLGFLVSAKSRTNGAKDDVKSSYNSANFAWSFGAGYQFPGTGAGIDARYNLGITDVNEVGPGHIKSRVFQVGLFYQFQH